jgi:glycosyltransferase involved in cell wall biosynthesis
MIIAVNTRILSGNLSNSKLLIRQFESIAAVHPEHEFIFISETEFPGPVINNNTIKRIVVPQQSANPLLRKLWYNYKLPSLLKKIGAAVLINADGVCSLRSKIPQCLVVNDLAFLKYPELYPKKYLRFIKSNTALYLKKAELVFTYSEVLKSEIIKKYRADDNKIVVLSPVVNQQFKPISWERKVQVKEQHTEGKDYFLFSGTIHPHSNLINLLKAFSLFKKRQKSNMQLVIASSESPQDAVFTESLQLYKYRSEVKLLTNIDDTLLAEITPAAYACINLSVLHGELSELLNAMHCEVPVIAGNLHTAIEILGDAALFASAGHPENIAEKLMLLYKDENKRNDLIQKGILHSEKYCSPAAEDAFWQNILKTMQQV